MLAPKLERGVEFDAFGKVSLLELLRLAPLPFSRRIRRPFRQLEYIEKYVADLIAERGPDASGTIVRETHYIDRDYIEDHSAFYSKTLIPYGNWCRRLHFFALPEESLKKRIREVLASASTGEENYRKTCAEFSADAYLTTAHGNAGAAAVSDAPHADCSATRN